MRVFSPEEQLFLRRIEQGRGGNLYNLIDPWIEGVSFDVDTLNNSVLILFDNTILTNQGRTLTERIFQIQSILIQSVSILKLFEEKGYFYSYRNTHIPNRFIFGQAVINVPSISYTFPDPTITELIIKYSTKELFITGELNRFIRAGFITREQANSNRQFSITIVAVFISAFGLLLTAGFNVYNAFFKKKDENKSNRDTIIIQDKNQRLSNFDSTNSKFTNLSVDSLNIKKDTIKQRQKSIGTKKKNNSKKT